ncbi:TPA: flagellar hook-associated protein 3 [Candidatus Poribacteria bacterium]|nr:flagellar hook-associated protein 3 [Candidatus Poribacteria bacterium]
MRVTNKIIATQIKDTISQNAQRLQKSQFAIASGRRFNKPSDDPIGTTQAIKQRIRIDRINQINRNIDDGLGFLNLTDTVLGGVRSQLVRAKEIALAQTSGTANASDRALAAKEVAVILEDVVALANTEFNGRFIFAGRKTQNKPFNLEGAVVTYHGDDGSIQRQIGFDETIQTNVTGSEVFAKTFETLINLKETLEQNNRAGIEATLAELDANIESILTIQSDVGAKVNRLETQKERLLDSKMELTQILSDTEDVDLAEAIMEFSLKQTALQAALESAARIIQPSLLNFLR